MKSYDIAIVGGGMVGVTAALSYAQLGFDVVLVEAIEPEKEASPSFDQRAIALSAASVTVFRTLGVWENLAPLACEIQQIHVSDRGNMGFTRLYASDYQLDALGHVLPLDQAGPILWQLAQTQPKIDTWCPATVTSFDQHHDYCELKCDRPGQQESARSLRATLVVAADGTFSHLAEISGIAVERKNYGQAAVVSNILFEQPHDHRAFERFTSTGPLALLPLTQNRMSLVWCHPEQDIEKVMDWNDDDFAARLQQAFGFRLGKVARVGNRSSYPLSLHMAAHKYRRRLLLLGNAAHTLHPIAGQGFNLGLRDMAALNDLLLQTIADGKTIGDDFFMQEYVQARRPDWQKTILATDSLTRLFSSELAPVVLSRNAGMTLLNLLPCVKNSLAQSAMGYGLRASRLARGIANHSIR